MKRILLLLLVVVAYLESSAQYYYKPSYYYREFFHVTIGVNAIRYSGDVVQTLDNLRPGVTFSLVAPLADRVHLRLNVVAGSYRGADSLSAINKQRNLHFKSPLYGADLLMMVEPFKDSRNKFFRKSHISPYLVYGVGGFYMNPQALYQGRWVELQPLGTEGQQLPQNLANSYPKPYKLLQFSLPIGGGISYYATPYLSINADFIYHFTFTDYMDDVGSKFYPSALAMQTYNPVAAALSNRTGSLVSESLARGNPSKRDGYLVPSLTLSYHLPIKKW